MSPPRKWRIAGPIELDPTEMETLTPRQAGRAEFKERQHLYENMIRERHPGGTWELGFRSGKQEKPKGFARREARLAEGNVKRGKAPDVVAAPRSSKTRNVEGALEGSAVMETAPVVPLLGEMSFLRVEEDGPREVNIAELVRPQRNTRTRERVRRPETIEELMTSDLERAILESLRSEYLPDESEEEDPRGDDGEDEWEIADGSVFSFDMMSVASKA